MGEALKVVTGEVVDDRDRAIELDKQIRKIQVESYLDLAPRLIEMRDEDLYKKLPIFDGLNVEVTWAHYCQTVQGLSESQCNRIVRAYLIYQAIVKHGSTPTGQLPESERQLRVIGEQVATFKVRKPPVGSKSNPVPVAVANPKTVADEWALVVSAYDAYVAKEKKQNPGKVPRRLSGKFIESNFSGEARRKYRESVGKGDVTVTDKRHIATMCRRFGAATEKLRDIMEDRGMAELAEKEHWTDRLRETVIEDLEATIVYCKRFIKEVSDLELYVD